MCAVTLCGHAQRTGQRGAAEKLAGQRRLEVEVDRLREEEANPRGRVVHGNDGDGVIEAKPGPREGPQCRPQENGGEYDGADQPAEHARQRRSKRGRGEERASGGRDLGPDRAEAGLGAGAGAVVLLQLPRRPALKMAAPGIMQKLHSRSRDHLKLNKFVITDQSHGDQLVTTGPQTCRRPTAQKSGLGTC